MSLFTKFFGPPKPRDPVAAERIKQWAKAQLDEDAQTQDEIAVTVSEIECNDPGCPGTETVILIMQPYHTTRAIKISKLMDQIDQSDICSALET